MASKGEHLDPEVYILAKRVAAVRRAKGKRGANEAIITSILKEYRRKKEPGTAEAIGETNDDAEAFEE